MPPSSATVTFVSDASTSAPGFRLAYQLAPCSRSYQEPQGRILSPSWPHRLPRNITCTFTVAAPPGRYLSLYTRYLALSSSPNCSSTYLEVRDGPSATSPLLTRLCGRAIPATLMSSGPALWFHLVSASRGWSQGYDLSYTSSVERGCGGEVTGTRGALTSPGFPSAAGQVPPPPAPRRPWTAPGWWRSPPASASSSGSPSSPWARRAPPGGECCRGDCPGAWGTGWR